MEQPGAGPGVRNYVYKVRNSKALAIVKVLTELYAAAPTGPSSSPAPGTAVPGMVQPSPAAVPPQTFPGATVPGVVPQARQLQGNLRIIADEENNAIVIQGSPQQYNELVRTIEELDVLKRQVLVDAQIFEVVLDHSLELGLSARLQARASQNPLTTASFQSSAGPAAFSGQTFALVGKTRELLAFLTATENRSRVRALSAPSLLVSDNVQAEFQVGTEIPIPTSSSVTPVQSGGTNLFAQTIQFRNTGVILRVKPQINDSGNVSLEIQQEVSQAGTNTTSAIVAPVIGKSSVSSTVTLRDGETVALSGFIRENNELGRNRLPLLGNIPWLGAAFGNTRRSSSRSELIVLITPHVARTFEETNKATEELKSRLTEIRKAMK